MACVENYCSLAKLCPTLYDPMNGSRPGFPVLDYLLELAQTHVHWVRDAIQPSHPVVPFSSCPQSFPAFGSCPMSQLFTSSGQSIGASASTSVFPMNTQDWFPLGLTGLISLLTKGLSRVFSSVIIQRHQFSGTRPSFSYLLATVKMGQWQWKCNLSVKFWFQCFQINI